MPNNYTINNNISKATLSYVSNNDTKYIYPKTSSDMIVGLDNRLSSIQDRIDDLPSTLNGNSGGNSSSYYKNMLISYLQKTNSTLTLPEGVTRIPLYYFEPKILKDGIQKYINNNLRILNLPSTLQYIYNTSYGIFNCLPTYYDNNFACPLLESINVDNNNNYYSSENGILYNKNKTILYMVPPAKTFTNNTFNIPNSVTFLYAMSLSFINANIINIPSSVTSIGANTDSSNSYSGNIYSTFSNNNNIQQINAYNNIYNTSLLIIRNKSLETINIIDSNQQISNTGYICLMECDSLVNLNLAEGIKYISIIGCTNLTSFPITNNNIYSYNPIGNGNTSNYITNIYDYLMHLIYDANVSCIDTNEFYEKIEDIYTYFYEELSNYSFEDNYIIYDLITMVLGCINLEEITNPYNCELYNSVISLITLSTDEYIITSLLNSVLNLDTDGDNYIILDELTVFLYNDENDCDIVENLTNIGYHVFVVPSSLICEFINSGYMEFTYYDNFIDINEEYTYKCEALGL